MGRRFLIGQLGHFGDCLYATTIARQIKQDFPDSVVTWAIAEKYKSILLHNPDVDHLWVIKTAQPHGEDWNKFVQEALRRRHEGEFDEVIFSQLQTDNCLNFVGTLRETALSHYKRPITVSARPVVRLAESETENVRRFADKHALQDFKQVILFECNPVSGQSDVNLDLAISIAQRINSEHPDTCFVLSSTQKLSLSDPRIVDASCLSFRENAELTRYCTMLIGCSSGITWLSTSDWAKRLPMIQLLRDCGVYFGVAYDHQRWNLEHQGIIEMTTWTPDIATRCLQTALREGFDCAKSRFHQQYQPNLATYANFFRSTILGRYSARTTMGFIRTYYRRNRYLPLMRMLMLTIGILLLHPLRLGLEYCFPHDTSRRQIMKKALHCIGLSRFLKITGQI